MTPLRQWFAIFLSFCLVYSQVFFNLAYAQGIETDGTTQTTLDAARNGVTIVNIAKPSSRGLSHNKFKKYNVNKQGVILNNSGDTCVKTQLGGYIYGNKHLNAGSAKVILNEVTSASRSYLNGYTEVAGQSADLVLVNPNGISMNGAGFINIPNITFSTGTVNLDAGQIDSFSVNQGDILIEGSGLNTKTQQSTYIYTKSLQLNAKIHARDLNIELGSNEINNKTKVATAAASAQTSSKDAVMLDSSALGGMYANRITLVGTEKGVGVNLPPEVLASTGDITITADGKIQLNDLAAKTDIKVTSASNEVALQGTSHSGKATRLNANTDIVTGINTTIVSENDIHLTSGNTFTNQGTLMAGIDGDGNADYTGTIELHNTELINQNKIATGTLNADDITNTNAEITAQAINSTNLNNSQGTIKGGESIAVTTTHLNNTYGTLEANKTLSIESQTIDLDNSSLYANETLNLKLKALDNIATSKIESNGNLNIEATDYITNNSDLLANGNLSLKTNGALTNSQAISAQQELDIQGNSLTNSGIDAKIAGGSGNSVISTNQDINNLGRISALDRLTINSTDLVNQGSINAGNQLTTNTENLTNHQTLISGGGMNLNTTETLLNKADANIYSFGDMTLAANQSGGKTAHIKNETANIETYDGNLTIQAEFLENTTYDPEISSNSKDLPRQKISHGHRNSFDYVYTTITTQSFSNIYNEDGDIIYKTGKIISGKDLTINSDTINNDYSLIAANQEIKFHTKSLVNKSASSKTITNVRTEKYRNKQTQKWKKKCHWLAGCHYIPVWVDERKHRGTDYDSNEVANDTVSATIEAGGGIEVTGGGILTNGTTGKPLNSRTLLSGETGTEQAAQQSINSQALKIFVPEGNHGLFVKSKNPDSKYLIETNPEFTYYNNFISSDYMMDQLNIDPAVTTKRVGDAFYENKLIRDSIFQQTGRRFLDQSIKNDNDQFKYLMDNAIKASKNLSLASGIALSQDQINRLTSDIVWMEERIIQGQKVLVPVVYIANKNNYNLVDGSKIVAGENIKLEVASLVNSGSIEAEDSLSIAATDAITNLEGRLLAEKDINLEAKNDIRNTSGSIEAENITIKSGEGNFVHETYAEKISFGSGDVISDKTKIGNTGKIDAKGTLSIDAAKSATFRGSEVKASEMNVKAENVHVGTVKNERHFHSEKGEDGEFLTDSSTTHIASLIEVDNLDINSTGTTTIEGSNIQAADKIKIQAKKLDIVSVNDTSHVASNSKSGGDFGSSEKSKTKFISTNKAASLSAANMELITTEDDITVGGSNVSALESLTLDSAQDINIVAGYDGSFKEKKTKESGFFRNNQFYSETEDLEGRMTKTAVASNISADNLTLKSNRDLLVEGSNLSGGTISGEAQNITVKAAENEEKTWSKSTKKSMGFGDVADTLNRPDKVVKTKDKKLTAKIADAQYEDVDRSTKKTTVASSSLEGENISLTANSEEDFEGNILIEGSNLNANESISLTASNDVSVIEAKETTETKSSSTKGKAELTVGVKHQAVEVVKAAEALQLAMKARDKAKEAYDDYKDQLKNAERQYKAGLIEKEDLDDVRDDKRFYEANVVLTEAALGAAIKNLTQQTIAAISSSTTYGFNAEAQLDIDAIVEKAKDISTRSVGSNLNANTIEINAGNRALVRGSNLNANEQIAIDAEEVEIAASRDTTESTSSTEHAHITLNYSVHGGASANATADFSESSNRGVTYNNARLNSKNISITSKEDTYVTGAVVKADENLDLDVGGNLKVASLQDRSRSKSNSVGVSGGGSSGSSSAGFNASMSRGKRKWVNEQTALLGGNVSINVTNHTELKGAKIAAVDENGNDNGNLSLTTQTLSYEDIRNRDNSTNMSASVNVSQSEIPVENGKPKKETSTGGSIGFGFSDKTAISKATIGLGTIKVGNESNPKLEGLNRKIEVASLNIKDTGSQMTLDDATLNVMLNPIETATTVKDDVLQLKSLAQVAADIIDAKIDKEKREEGGEDATAKQVLDAIVDGFTSVNSLSKKLREKSKNTEDLKTTENQDAITVEKGINVYFKDIQDKLQVENPGSIKLASHYGLGLERYLDYMNYLGATDEDTGQSFLIFDHPEMDITNGADIARVATAEALRQKFRQDHLFDENNNRNDGFETLVEEAIAKNAGLTFETFSNEQPAKKAQPTEVFSPMIGYGIKQKTPAQQWNEKNGKADFITTNTDELNATNPENVKPYSADAAYHYYNTVGEDIYQRAHETAIKWVGTNPQNRKVYDEYYGVERNLGMKFGGYNSKQGIPFMPGFQQHLKSLANEGIDPSFMTMDQLDKEYVKEFHGNLQLAPIISGFLFSQYSIARQASGPKAIIQDYDSSNPIQLEKYKIYLRRNMVKPNVQNPSLKKLVDKNYRDDAIFGSGSTAEALRRETLTGKLTKGTRHNQKASEMVKKLNDWLRNNKNASLNDRKAAENILKDLQNAIDIKKP